MRKLIISVSVLLGLFVSGCATSSPEIGSTGGNSAEQLKKACELNKGLSCAKLGLLHADGIGVKKDFSKAHKYFKKACNLNNGMGCSYLGISYNNGLGIKQNSSLGKKYLQKGCDLNDGEGCFRLGIMYADKDNSKAIKYLEKACDLKNVQGCVWYTVLKDKGH